MMARPRTPLAHVVVVVVVDAMTSPVEPSYTAAGPAPYPRPGRNGVSERKPSLGASVTAEIGLSPIRSDILLPANRPGLCCSTRECQPGRRWVVWPLGGVAAVVPAVVHAKRRDPIALPPSPGLPVTSLRVPRAWWRCDCSIDGINYIVRRQDPVHSEAA